MILKHRWDDIREVIWQTLLHTVCCVFPMIEWDWAMTNVVSFWTKEKTYSIIRCLQCYKFKVWKAAGHQTNNESNFVDQFEGFCGKVSENCNHFWDYSKYSHEGIFEISIYLFIIVYNDMKTSFDGICERRPSKLSLWKMVLFLLIWNC